MRRALAEVSGWGPFFAAEVHDPGGDPVPPWRPLREPADDPGVLRDRVETVRAYLAAGHGRDPSAVPLRVAASVTQMGLTARMISPVLAVAVRTGRVLDLTGAWWRPELGGAFPLSLTAETTDDGDPAATFAVRILNGPVRDLVMATEVFSVSPGILWGNVASAVNGAATMLTRARPDLAAPARTLTTRLLATPPLTGTADHRAGTFRRRTCCLIYQAGAPDVPRSLCGDCVLAG